MDTAQKLINYHLSRLKNKSPEVRLSAIQELEVIGNHEVLATLEQVYRTDADESVRDAAQTAGRKLFVRLSKKA
ncbi:MAG: HEAT repeat domain-containing protein [Phototrophicaceae bacterium]